MRTITVFAMAVLAATTVFSQETPRPATEVGTFAQDVRQFYTTSDGLPSDDVKDMAVAPDGTVYVATAKGLALLANGRWTTILADAAVYRVALDTHGNVHLLEDGGMGTCGPRGEGLERTHTPLHSSIPSAAEVNRILVPDGALVVASEAGPFVATDRGGMMPYGELGGLIPSGTSVRDVAFHGQESAVASSSGLVINDGAGWKPAFPGEGVATWNPVDARGVAYDETGRLWVVTPQGVARKEGDSWRLFTGKEGLPYADFTSIATGANGVVWFGTHKGAVRYDGTNWAYRQGLRWLPDDDVRDVAVGPDGAVWFATAKGVGVIRARQTTLAEKAVFFEDEIDTYHRRTPYEYVLEVSLANAGDKSQWTQHDSDNDGLWTSMYGAGECFAYAATKDPKAKERAKQAFEALHFLGEVTQGGTHPAPKGFVARSILPTSGPDPNINDSPEHDRERQQSDPKWKVITPRWPVSADGQWYWKTDTSSDELDGHYFFYGLYYDLVADTEDEKARVREHVRALTDNIVDHDFNLVDHDGLPTRWAVYGPKSLNGDPTWYGERGLNSLSILSYLATAEHITGDAKYRDAANGLIENHGYVSNMLSAKVHIGIGTGNQSDDEMAFMGYYNLLNYEKDERLRGIYLMSLYRYWLLEEPEANPFFTFVVGAVMQTGTPGQEASRRRMGLNPESVARSVEELKRFPLDRFNWGHDNSVRLDIVPLPRVAQGFGRRGAGSGYRVDGYVIPVDERYFNHYNHNPWSLREGGDGRELGDGAVYLLPYYMGLYHGFLK